MEMLKRRTLARGFFALSFLGACTLLFSGCSEESQQAGQEALSGKVFIMGDTTFNAENEEYDINPHNAYSGWAALRYGVGETLFRYSDRMEVEPWLAVSAKAVDPLTWEIELRENVRFSNGRPMDAAALKASLDRLIETHRRARGDLKIASIEADGLRLTIRTEVPRPALLNFLSDPYGAVVDVSAGVTPEGIVVGTGPYAAEKLVTGERLELRRNEGYWGGMPGYERVRIRTISDGDTLTMALQSGEIDAAYGMPYASYPIFRNGKFHFSSTATSRVFFAHMNFESPVVKDPAVRRAIAMGIDKAGFVKTLLQENGYPAAGPFPEGVSYGGGSPAARPFDPEGARAVLEAAGWRDSDGDGVREKDGVRLTVRWLTYPSRQELPLLAEAAQASLRDLGMEVRIQSTADVGRFRADRSTWDVYASAMVTAPTGDPENFFRTHCLESSVFNNGRYRSEALERAASELFRTFDPERRAALARGMSEELIRDDAFVFCSHLKMSMISRTGVEGLIAHPCDFYEITKDLRPSSAPKP